MNEVATEAECPVFPFFREARPRAEAQKVLECAVRDTERRLLLDEWRDECILEFGFSIPCLEAVEAVVSRTSALLEVAAGTGYWTRILRDAGVDVVATDLHGNPRNQLLSWHELSAADSVDRYPDRDVFLSWPYHKEPWAFEMAQRIRPGVTLFYIGEWGGCTADDDFHDYLLANFDDTGRVAIPNWTFSRDWLWILRRR